MKTARILKLVADTHHLSGAEEIRAMARALLLVQAKLRLLRAGGEEPPPLCYRSPRESIDEPQDIIPDASDDEVHQ